MRTRLCVLALLAGCFTPHPRPPAGGVVLRIEGMVENAPFTFGRDDLPRLPRRAFEAVAPFANEHQPARFEGVAVAQLLADEMEVMREADIAVVHGEDGVAVPVPLPMIRQLKPVLADSVGGERVEAWRAGAAPLQLAWPNVDHPGVDTDPRMPWWWVGGVSRIEIRSWTATYGKALRVPSGASDAARLGVDVLASRCIGCHRVRGVGGTRGPALTGNDQARARLPARLRTHLRAVSGIHDIAEPTPEEVASVAAFLEAVAIAGEDDDEVIVPPRRAPERPLPPGSLR